MIDEVQLKEKLQILAQNDFRLEESNDLSVLIPEMQFHIGSTDAFLRDNLIYRAFTRWILSENTISNVQLRDLLHKTIGEQYIFYNIGEQNTDTVFRRSFSILLLPLIITAHRSRSFLTQTEIHQVKEALFRYLREEKDRRRYVNNKGWAHTTAHAADALDDLAQCSELDEADLIDILEAIRTVISAQDTGYIQDEEERMVTAVISIINRSLVSDVKFVQWIRDFANLVLSINSIPQELIIRANIKNFLQSLYFRLQWEYVKDIYCAPINQTLRTISLFTGQEEG